MKYIKTYEYLNAKKLKKYAIWYDYEYRSFYNPGDIIIIDQLKLSGLGVSKNDELLPTIGCITEIEKKGEFESSFIYNIDLGNLTIRIGRNKIKRFADTAEIEEYNMKKNITKYNL